MGISCITPWVSPRHRVSPEGDAESTWGISMFVCVYIPILIQWFRLSFMSAASRTPALLEITDISLFKSPSQFLSFASLHLLWISPGGLISVSRILHLYRIPTFYGYNTDSPGFYLSHHAHYIHHNLRSEASHCDSCFISLFSKFHCFNSLSAKTRYILWPLCTRRIVAILS